MFLHIPSKLRAATFHMLLGKLLDVESFCPACLLELLHLVHQVGGLLGLLILLRPKRADLASASLCMDFDASCRASTCAFAIMLAISRLWVSSCSFSFLWNSSMALNMPFLERSRVAADGEGGLAAAARSGWWVVSLSSLCLALLLGPLAQGALGKGFKLWLGWSLRSAPSSSGALGSSARPCFSACVPSTSSTSSRKLALFESNSSCLAAAFSCAAVKAAVSQSILSLAAVNSFFHEGFGAIRARPALMMASS